MKVTVWVSIQLLCVLLMSGCGEHNSTSERLESLIEAYGFDGQFEGDSTVTSDELVGLGGSLFFSPDLSLDGSVSCASCHHPSKAGADGIALPIGIGGVDSRNIGQKRLDIAQKANPDISLEGLIPRNTPSVINVALYRQAMFWDGRVKYAANDKGEKYIEAGFGAAQLNPSGYAQETLLQTQARMPITSAFEMKGGLAPYKNNHEIEQGILEHLQSSKVWCKAFAKVFANDDCKTAITLNNLTRALAEYQASLVFTDSPFERYIRGDEQALTEEQKQGAILFLSSKESGGVGCVNCHAGKHFTNEQFYNLGVPASGRGANDGGWDFGHQNVDKLAEKFSFRVPSLLNVSLTSPYFHNGTALTMADAIALHQQNKPADKATIIALDGLDYPAITRVITAQASSEKSAAKRLLPVSLTDGQISLLVAFLESLTDPCLQQESCWKKIIYPVIETPRPETEDELKPQVVRRVTHSAITPPKLSCPHLQQEQETKWQFSRHASDIGLNHQRNVGLIKKGWLIDVVNYSAVTAMDVNYDCLDDLIFDLGEDGLKFYFQRPDGHFQEHALSAIWQPSDVTPMVMDLDGDYQFDLVIGNMGENAAHVVFDFLGQAENLPLLKPLGPVINSSVADMDSDGDLDIGFALWRSFNTLPQEHLWLNDGIGNLTPLNKITLRQSDRDMGGNAFVKRLRKKDAGAPDLTFTPNFADIDNDGDDDLLLAADFSRSQVLRNDKGQFVDITDKTVIDDNNGMGAAVADFDNDGDLDWFVTSINDERLPAINGHRIYRNQGNGVFSKEVIDLGTQWSWAACARDFNNDGWQDLFYISGFGEPLPSARYESEAQQKASKRFLQQTSLFSGSKPTLLINDGHGHFTDASKEAGLPDVLDGRAISCFDYQQDGDIDIVVAGLEGAPALFKNHLNGSKNWLALRLIGLPGNTEAFGTKVTVYTAENEQYREVMFENNYISRNPAQLHFGLGDETTVERIVIELPAPNRKVIEMGALPINQLHTIYLEELLSAEVK